MHMKGLFLYGYTSYLFHHLLCKYYFVCNLSTLFLQYPIKRRMNTVDSKIKYNKFLPDSHTVFHPLAIIRRYKRVKHHVANLINKPSLLPNNYFALPLILSTLNIIYKLFIYCSNKCVCMSILILINTTSNIRTV